nr:HNH endonuclease [Deltaproteobacteria bacterium]
MAKAVFTAQPGTRYDDLPEVRYHFPNAAYLSIVRAALGDQIIYYEPERTPGNGPRTGRKAYFAVATVDRIEQDPANAAQSYAWVRDFIAFDEPVPFRDTDGVYIERGLTADEGRRLAVAMHGRSVRAIDERDFMAIVDMGFRASSADPHERSRVPYERALRDRAFTRNLREAYGRTCALTGLRIENGGGWTEAQAAHIRSVADQGPDSVRNGLLLSSTIHALFDRGFLALQPYEETYKVLVASAYDP